MMWKSGRSFFLLLSLFTACAGLSYLAYLRLTPLHSPRVYDCFLFFNELELLKIRLEEMGPYVDHFVIVEASETFRGAPKELNFQHSSLFEEFRDKIIYIPLREHFETNDPWNRERFQRAQIMQGLKDCKKTDVVLLSDLDEIVKGSSILKVLSLLLSEQVEAVVCEQKMYYGYLNRYWGLWPGTVAMRYETVKKLGVRNMRKLRNRKPRSLRKMGVKSVVLLKEAGWHFTSMGGAERCFQKVEAYSHAELDRPEFKTYEYFRNKVESMSLERIDSSFPSYVRQNLPYFESIHFLDSSHAASGK